MSRYEIEFGSERVAIELGDESEVESSSPPAALSAREAEAALREALETPRGFPPLRQNVVPGDRVAIALDPLLRHPRPILDVVTDVLETAGVAADDITIVEAARHDWPLVSGERGEVAEIHDPNDRDRLAYLATTAKGSRVYLNRTLIDADVVVPVGLLRRDPVTGPHGPWNVLFPGLSDAETREARRFSGEADSVVDDEAFEVGALLGSWFQVGVVLGSGGPAAFVAGLAEDVRDAGLAAVDRAWSFRPRARAETVVVGVGDADAPGDLHDLIAALLVATKLVRRGGRIVALSRVEGAFGPSLSRLAAVDDERRSRRLLRGHEADRDHPLAVGLLDALDWADVYLLSRLDPDVVENLGLIPLERPEEGARLASRSRSCLLVSRAERVHGEVDDPDAA
ncbi:lactate racemase domain-containing protein [Paludisphaera sp.]|uniref:lactate racemase domain-containing protein n=1 Tax=Paludisphaera sp. TaxID=2017432 RepID=UPI00301DA762